MSTTVRALMAVAALTLFAASAVHASPIDPFPGAAPPEAVIGAVLAVAIVVGLVSPGVARPVAIGATLFAILGTLFGLSVTLPRGEPGDIAYHLGLLAMLLASGALLLRRNAKAVAP